jgi:hypothetical protein
LSREQVILGGFGVKIKLAHFRLSIIFTTNLNFSEWVSFFGDAKITTA